MNSSDAPTETDDVGDLRDLHGDVRKLIVAIGDLKTDIEKDRAAREAALWAKAPIWLIALAAIAIAVRTWLGG